MERYSSAATRPGCPCYILLLRAGCFSLGLLEEEDMSLLFLYGFLLWQLGGKLCVVSVIWYELPHDSACLPLEPDFKLVLYYYGKHVHLLHASNCGVVLYHLKCSNLNYTEEANIKVLMPTSGYSGP